ncbi:MAG: hypothetical protein JJE01_13660 [Gemmatimonadetes bacterium]|jgi:hypothetical protein|nr:hypothetical protein [Gemmatimonadota bacterium]
MLPLIHKSSMRPVALALVVFAIFASGCTKPVTTNVAPPMAASLDDDQEIVGLILTDGREQLFDEPGPVLQNGVWTGTAQGSSIQFPTSEVQQVIISEEKTNVLSIVAIVAFVGLGVAAIAIASEQR